MRIKLTSPKLSKLIMVFTVAVLVANLAALVDYLLIKRPILEFQTDFHERQDKFTDSLKNLNRGNEVFCIVFQKNSPYLYIILNVSDSSFNQKTSRDLIAAAQRELLPDASCKEAVVLLRSDLKFAKHSFDLVRGTDSFSEIENGLIAKWCIEPLCQVSPK